MRITNQITLDRSIQSIQQSLQATARLERQITTGSRIQQLSDAPLLARTVMDIDAQLRASEQYNRNIEAAQARLALEDDALNSITNLLTRAREIAIQQGSATAGSESRAAALQEVQELRSALVQLANQKMNGAYVFGGVNSTQPPLDASGDLDPAAPARGAPGYEIAPSVTALGAHDAGEIFVDSDVIAAFVDLEAAIAADDSAAIRAEADRIQSVVANVQTLVADVGARQTRLDVGQSTLSVVDQARISRRSVLIDTPLEEAITELASRQASYQASLLATSRFLETSLVNFLR